MVLSYDYSNRNRRRRQTNAPLSLAISIAMAVQWCDTARIAQWRRSRALKQVNRYGAIYGATFFLASYELKNFSNLCLLSTFDS